MSWRDAARGFVILAVAISPIAWELLIAIAVVLPHGLSEISALAIAKIGFASVLVLVMLLGKRGRAWGFGGGLHLGSWGLMWPIWAASAISLIQDFQQGEATQILLWLPIAFAVALGEEGVFRGAIMSALDAKRPRRQVLLSALLFGLVHLAGFITPIDPRMIAAQAAVAAGLGVILGAMRLRTRSIWPGIMAHGILDFTGLLAVDGLVEAMEYSLSSVVYMLVGAAVAAGWGLFLCRDLTVAENPSIIA